MMDGGIQLPEFASCVAGTVERAGIPGTITCYDTEKVLATLRKNHGMSAEDAQEWFEFNVLGAWWGEGTPCFITRPE